MEIWKEIIIIIIAILISIREGLVFRELRKYWKPTGMILRGLLVLLLYPNILLMLISLNILWTGYDIMCAWGLKQKWYYLGVTGIIDKWDWFNYLLKTLLLITLIIYIFI